MFDSLSQRLNKTLKNLTGRGRLSEKNIADTLKDVRKALLDADVAVKIVKQFTNDVKKRAVGQEVKKSLNPGQAMVKIVHEELVTLMGEACDKLNLKTQPPAIILLAGLQGSGKTTSAAKLAKFLQEKEKKSVMLVSTDVYRPAAIEQLATLSEDIGAKFFPSTASDKPVKITKAAIKAAQQQHQDVLIIDTAGRLHVDNEMMSEIKEIHKESQPIETLFVVDSMTGQDAANTALAFHEALPLTGVILTKTDGDARGGAALSVRATTGKPIKFMGIGEKTDALEPFYPDRVASRILGMGDMLSLIEEIETKVDKEQAKELATKIKKGKSFTLDDFLQQLQQMKSMGGLSSIMEKLPGSMGIPAQAQEQLANNKQFGQMEAIICSMTKKERHDPDLIKMSHKRRIASGSGTEIQDVNRVLKQFNMMQKTMKKLKGGGLNKLMKQFGGMMGMPPR